MVSDCFLAVAYYHFCCYLSKESYLRTKLYDLMYHLVTFHSHDCFLAVVHFCWRCF